MLDQDTKRRIDTARQILVGKIPDPKAQVEQITTALIYKFMDDMDRQNEELGSKARFLVGKLKEYAWGRLLSKELSGEQRIDLYVRALTEFTKSEQIPPLFRTIFKGTFLPYRDPETLNLFLKEINGFSYDDSEELGNSFEYLLSVLGAQGKAGQFRTPRHIIDFIVEVVDPQKDDKILDPACGTAGFLISAFKHIKHCNSSNFNASDYVPSFSQKAISDVALIEIQSNGNYRGDKLTPDARKKLAKNIIGYDISPDMVRLSLVNMYLHGFNTPQIFEYDTLTYEDRWGDNFDIILANPPFMSPTGGIRPHRRFRVSANRSEVLFVDYIAEHLTLKGRAGVIVPEGIIFQSANAYKDLRKMLIEDNLLWAVVSLPAGVFKPYSGVKTSILFFDRERAKQNDEILFVKVSNDGFDLGDQRRAIDENDLPEAYRVLQEWQKGNKLNSSIAQPVKKKAILDSRDYNFTGDRYRPTIANGKTQWPMVALGDSRYFTIESGGTPDSSNPEFWEGDINWVTLVDLPQGRLITEISSTSRKLTSLGLKKSSAKLLPPDTVLVSSRATIGRIGIARVPIATNQGFKNIVIKDHQSVEVAYIAYVVSHLVPDMIRLGSGGTYKEISKTSFSKLEVPLPPLEVQKEIVAELGAYQRVIDGARQIVDNWKPTIKIDPKWEMVKLGDVCEINPKKSEVNGKPKNTEVSFVPMESLNEHQISFVPKESRLLKDVYKGYTYFKNEDVLLAKVTPCFENGKSGIAKILTNGIGFGTTELIVLRQTDKIRPEWIYYFISSHEFLTQGKNHMSGTGGLQRLSKHFVQNYQIPLPPLKEQLEIISDMEAEQQSVEAAKKLIELHERKIKNKIAEIWGE
jgi:type I restriction enzyme M protein